MEVVIFKKLFKNGVIICGTIVVLTGCSNDGVNSKETNSKVIKIGDVLKSPHEHISYQISDDSDDDEKDQIFGKDTTIDYYIVSKNGKAKVYDGTGDTTLGEVSKMDTNEIKKRMKKEDKEYFDKDKKDTIEELQNDAQEINDQISNEDEESEDEEDNYKDYIKEHGNVPEKSIDKIKKVKYKEPKAQKIKVSIDTDDSGNSTEEEKVKFYENGFYTYDLDAPDSVINEAIPVTATADYASDIFTENNYDTTTQPTDIYDKKYAGLNYTDEDGDTYNLITEIGKKTKNVKLDGPKDKYVDKVDGHKND